MDDGLAALRRDYTPEQLSLFERMIDELTQHLK